MQMLLSTMDELSVRRDINIDDGFLYPFKNKKILRFQGRNLI